MDQRADDAPGTASTPTEKPTKSWWQRFARLSPVNRRRWERFQAHKIGYRSFLIFSVLFVVSLFAEFVANDRPLMVSYKGDILFPRPGRLPRRQVWRLPRHHRLPHARHPERDQRQRLDAVAADPLFLFDDQQGLSRPRRRQRRLPRISRASALVFVAKALRSSSRPTRPLQCVGKHQLARPRRSRPGRRRARHLRLPNIRSLRLDPDDCLVRDRYRRPAPCRVISAARVDLIFQRVLEIWNSIPELFVLLILSSLFVPGFWTLLGILMIFSWTSLVGLVRAEFLRGRNLEYVRARARAWTFRLADHV